MSSAAPDPAPLPAAPAAAANPPARVAKPSGLRSSAVLGWLGALVVAGVLAWVLLQVQARLRAIDGMRATLSEATAALERERRRADELERRAERLEGRLSEVEAQLAAPATGANAEIARARDEVLLLEIDRLLGHAVQELQLAGSVPAAVAALQSADGRAAHLQRPQPALRRALAADLEALRGIQVVDVAGIAVRLDQVAQGIPNWILLADAGQRLAVEPGAARARRNPPGAPAPAAAPLPFWEALRDAVEREFGDLVRIRRVDTPQALLLDAGQAELVRERLRLRLLVARQAVLARNERIARAEFGEAIALIERHFDPRQAAVAAALAQLRQFAATPVAFEPPATLASVAALRPLLGAGR